jgi:hypothetical protein
MRLRSTWIPFFSGEWLCVCAKQGHEPALCRSSHDWQATENSTPPHPLYFSHGRRPCEKREKKWGGGTVMVATQSRFHRDMLDGEQIASKAMKFHLVPNLQVRFQQAGGEANGVYPYWFWSRASKPTDFQLSCSSPESVSDVSLQAAGLGLG